MPAFDDRELDKRIIDGPFAPEGCCPWYDRRRGWVAEHKRRGKRQAKPNRSCDWPSNADAVSA